MSTSVSAEGTWKSYPEIRTQLLERVGREFVSEVREVFQTLVGLHNARRPVELGGVKVDVAPRKVDGHARIFVHEDSIPVIERETLRRKARSLDAEFESYLDSTSRPVI